MAGRFNPDLKSAQLQIRDKNAFGQCGLISCSQRPSADESFCSRSHCLEWMCHFASTLQPEQFCRMDGCPRHVIIEENLTRRQFCGWRHSQKYMLRAAMLHCMQLPIEKQTPAILSSPCTKSLVDALRTYANDGKVPNCIKIDMDFFEKHPWEVCTEGQQCLLIVPLNFNKQKRKLITKNGYHWKQRGRPSAKGSGIKKYFSYEKLKGSQVKRNNGSYHMDECTTEDVKEYSIIILRGRSNTNK
ncbi:hypothetical protein KP509_37G035300 [Ceratopteris richardii]|uniref:Uncharacterized protein n=1 Tax=Ceratopteris richardii TaxID=49495 RepID=A0A8T2Q7K5_CERRI|nr:hypothetical protein KP509_37G035300 [Ceratopteris richardii]KAH7279764.1 hypothetical protein KP509_37G035300 [Ceratopteris richardii]